MLKSLAVVHDGLTRLTFQMATAAVFYLTAVTAFEVASRYLFLAPTDWAPDTSAIAFAFIAFLAVPELTRQSGHAAMTFVVQHARPAVAIQLTRLSLAIAFIACAICTWFGAVEGMRQVNQGVTMIAVLPIPKWIVTFAIVYGLASTALYFMRQFCATFMHSNAKESSEWSGTYS
jgi:TRAP-type C4-dicarboxylate transport system permease small subunit